MDSHTKLHIAKRSKDLIGESVNTCDKTMQAERNPRERAKIDTATGQRLVKSGNNSVGMSAPRGLPPSRQQDGPHRPLSGKTVADALGGEKAGAGWTACCPAHEDTKPSLAISNSPDGKLLVYCHAGCSQDQVISALKARGLWDNDRRAPALSAGRVFHQGRAAHLTHNDAKRSACALRIWAASFPAAGTPVEGYLNARGLTLPPLDTLRYHPALPHPDGSHWPAMIGLVTRGTDEKELAIHRTYLARDGCSKAPVEPDKMMLGPCHGGGIRLGIPTHLLMIGEGIETCLAAMQATGYPAWAALSTSGLKSIDLPTGLNEVIILADGDKPGEAAAQIAARRWQSSHKTHIARPPSGLDFNDLLTGKGSTSQ